MLDGRSRTCGGGFARVTARYASSMAAAATTNGAEPPQFKKPPSSKTEGLSMNVKIRCHRWRR